MLLILLVSGAALDAQNPPPTPTPTPWPVPENVEKFTVRTNAPLNREIPFYVRRPRGFEPSATPRPHRLLFICPPYNGDPLPTLNGEGPLLRLADERDWFIVSPKFTQERTDVRDRLKSYYYPEGFSGQAVLDAFAQIARKYPVDTNHIFMKGISGGAQFVHRFALWAPERVVAVAVNSSSWFDEPNEKSVAPAFLVTIGDSDPSYDNSLQFVDQLRQVGATPLFRSYIAMVHEGDDRVNKLNDAFLTFYDDLTRDQLGQRISLLNRDKPLPNVTADQMPFIGDSLDWRYFENSEDNRADIPEDSIIFLPSEPIANLWGEK